MPESQGQNQALTVLCMPHSLSPFFVPSTRRDKAVPAVAGPDVYEVKEAKFVHGQVLYKGSWFEVQGLCFNIWGSGIRVQGAGFMVYASIFGVQELEFRV